MPKESLENKKIRAAKIAKKLNEILPDPDTELQY